MTDLKNAMTQAADAVSEALDALLPPSDEPEGRVIEAMRYACLNGGKRLRPFLVLASSKLFNVAEASALRTAMAIELVHCYSLVHDDLPAMDDDDLRRGQPTVHKAFDEATAILAGDALLTKAFEVLSDERTHADPAVRCELVRMLAQASGEVGMVGGQMFDLQADVLGVNSVPQVTRLQQMKTGRLIAFACEAGPVLAKEPAEHRLHLAAYAHDLGLAFQIADDILDVEGAEEEVGKAVGKDADAGKATFVSLLGLERAKEQAQILADQACAHLDSYGAEAQDLRQVARFVVERRS